MYDYTLQREIKHFSCYYLRAFRTAETLKSYIKKCFKINGKQGIKIHKKVHKLDSKFMKEIQSPHL